VLVAFRQRSALLPLLVPIAYVPATICFVLTNQRYTVTMQPLMFAFVALALAFERLVAAGILKSSPLIDTVAATSVGIVDDRALLDLAYEEDSRAEVDMNVVMTGSGHFVEIQATAEGRPFSGSEMQDLLALAAAGIRRLTEEQRAVLPVKFSARAR
jgi:ribonuclease PH